MGEWSKKIGEYGENVVKIFFSAIGWYDLATGISLPCLNNQTHLNDKDKPKETHGIDFLFSYINPLVSGQLNNIVISSKYKTEKYPNSATKLFKEFMEDLITTVECYQSSTLKFNSTSNFNYSSANDIGVLFWLNNNPDSTDDLISIVANARIVDTYSNNTIFLMDNKRVAFILEVMKFVKTKSNKYDYSFYYPNTGQNINPVERQNAGKILPVEYLNSSIIPVRLVNKDNQKEICLLLATLDDFDIHDLLRLIGLAKDITTELVGSIIIAFPDYQELKHSEAVAIAKQNFQANEFTKTISVINFLNPISVF
ncbi:GapS4a family protein [Flavobacterium sp. JP2137]|uniref:GapS4a family protein n=1 Tax=Flavobacterium sp. JP2137 TaxID=3414510 RepID=UPI003D2FD217